MLHKNVCVNALCISCSKEIFGLLFIFKALFILLYTALKAQNACFFVFKCFTSQSTISFTSARFLDITSTFRGVNASLLKDTTRRGGGGGGVGIEPRPLVLESETVPQGHRAASNTC